MLLHVFFSDNKFLDPTIDQFEQSNPGRNKYLVILRDNQFKFDKSYYQHLDKCTFIQDDKKLVTEAMLVHDVIIIHRLSAFVKDVLASFPKQNHTLVWFCWGGDIYAETCFFSKNFALEPQTKGVQERIESNSGSDFNFIRALSSVLGAKRVRPIAKLVSTSLLKLKGRELRSSVVMEAVAKIDFIATVIPSEYALLRSRTNLKASQVYFSYANLKLLLGPHYESNPLLGNNILIGNAATYSNNQIDALNLIRKSLAEQISFKLICPLSYGESDAYKNAVIAHGAKLFGEAFTPVTEFMPRDVYTEQLISCGYMVMNNKRQEAVGNIILGLYLGMKVFLSAKSVVFTFLKEKGMVVFDLAVDFDESTLVPLSEDEKKHNRSVIEEIWGEDKTDNHIKNLIKTVGFDS